MWLKLISDLYTESHASVGKRLGDQCYRLGILLVAVGNVSLLSITPLELCGKVVSCPEVRCLNFRCTVGCIHAMSMIRMIVPSQNEWNLAIDSCSYILETEGLVAF
jgi:hypothetical protein